MADIKLDPNFLIRPYDVTVDGFSGQVFHATSRGKALASAWNSYIVGRGPISFGDFMQMARVRQGDTPPRFGEAIIVGGRPAFYVGYDSHYVQFSTPGGSDILNSHPLDVETPNGPAFQR